MSEDKTEIEENYGAVQPEIETPDELTLLKQRADLVGFKYHHRVGLDKLRKDLGEFMAAQNTQEAVQETITKAPVDASKAKIYAPDGTPLFEETEAEKNQRIKREAGKLVRVVVTCMNPNKREWEGEIFTVSNLVVGTFRKYVPFNNEEGWHIPNMMLTMIKDRKCQIFYNETLSNGQKIRKGKLIPEFNVVELPPLTKEELQELATKQAMAAGTAA